MMDREQTRYRLNMPLAEAFAFAMGWSDLGYAAATDVKRYIIGLLVLDSLEYSEQWRVSAAVRECLLKRWPPSFIV